MVVFLPTAARSSRGDSGDNMREQVDDARREQIGDLTKKNNEGNNGTDDKVHSEAETEEEAGGAPKERCIEESKENSGEDHKELVIAAAGEDDKVVLEVANEVKEDSPAENEHKEGIPHEDSEVKIEESHNTAPSEEAKFSKEEDIVKMRKIIDAASTFPEKLMKLLQHECEPEAIFWLPEGDSFGINKPLFEDRVLNKYFRGNKFTSITRNLNRW